MERGAGIPVCWNTGKEHHTHEPVVRSRCSTSRSGSQHHCCPSESIPPHLGRVRALHLFFVPFSAISAPFGLKIAPFDSPAVRASRAPTGCAWCARRGRPTRARWIDEKTFGWTSSHVTGATLRHNREGASTAQYQQQGTPYECGHVLIVSCNEVRHSPGVGGDRGMAIQMVPSRYDSLPSINNQLDG